MRQNNDWNRETRISSRNGYITYDDRKKKRKRERERKNEGERKNEKERKIMRKKEQFGLICVSIDVLCT